MSRRNGVPLATLLLAVALGCGRDLGPVEQSESLLRLEREWAAVIRGSDLERVFSFWAADAVIYPANRPAVRGLAAIRDFVEENRATPGFSLTLEPLEATVARSGDLGYTIGTYVMTARGEDGELLNRGGRYLSVWKKDPEGRWRCAVEVHSPLGAPDR